MKRNPDMFGERDVDGDPSKKRTPVTIYSSVKSARFLFFLHRIIKFK